VDEIIAKIKDYVLMLDESIEDDNILDFMISETVDRALIYMNRVQLIEDYESGDSETSPLPEALERAIARAVLSVYKTANAQFEGVKEARSVSDNGQSVTFDTTLKSYYLSLGDAQVFGDIKSVLDKFRIATIVNR
jgi:hypothetical protein